MTSMFGRLNDFAPIVLGLVLAVVGAMAVWNLGWGMLTGLEGLLANVRAGWWRYALAIGMVIVIWVVAGKPPVTKNNYGSFLILALMAWFFFFVAWRAQACADFEAALARATGIELTSWESVVKAWETYEAREPDEALRLWERYGKPSCALPDPGDQSR